MLYIAEVEIRVYPYMEDPYLTNKKHTIEAESEDEAKDKINNYYEGKCESHGGTNYSVYSVHFFEHIK